MPTDECLLLVYSCFAANCHKKTRRPWDQVVSDGSLLPKWWPVHLLGWPARLLGWPARLLGWPAHLFRRPPHHHLLWWPGVGFRLWGLVQHEDTGANHAMEAGKIYVEKVNNVLGKKGGRNDSGRLVQRLCSIHSHFRACFEFQVRCYTAVPCTNERGTVIGLWWSGYRLAQQSVVDWGQCLSSSTPHHMQINNQRSTAFTKKKCHGT